jgi:hypothetical protein
LSNSITLTRDQIERVAVMLALQENIKSVTIEETYESGIGPAHRATFHTNQLEREFQDDITDVSNW